MSMTSSPIRLLCLASAAALMGTAAQAGNSCSSAVTKGPTGVCSSPITTVINTPAGKRRTDSIFVGMNWNFGTKAPELVLGVRSLRTNTSKKSDGYQLDAFFPFVGGFSFDRVRLSYVGGQRSALGQLGLGYSFAQQSILGTVGVQVPYFTAGVDYLFRGTALPYVGLNSLAAPKLPTSGASSTTYSCTDPAVKGNATDYNGQIASDGGFTCFTAFAPT
jgi:hypothetical protein